VRGNWGKAVQVSESMVHCLRRWCGCSSAEWLGCTTQLNRTPHSALSSNHRVESGGSANEVECRSKIFDQYSPQEKKTLPKILGVPAFRNAVKWLLSSPSRAVRSCTVYSCRGFQYVAPAPAAPRLSATAPANSSSVLNLRVTAMLIGTELKQKRCPKTAFLILRQETRFELATSTLTGRYL
jgi:hypothetical protein